MNSVQILSYLYLELISACKTNCLCCNDPNYTSVYWLTQERARRLSKKIGTGTEPLFRYL